LDLRRISRVHHRTLSSLPLVRRARTPLLVGERRVTIVFDRGDGIEARRCPFVCAAIAYADASRARDATHRRHAGCGGKALRKAAAPGEACNFRAIRIELETEPSMEPHVRDGWR